VFEYRVLDFSKYLMTVNNKLETKCKESKTKVNGKVIPAHAMKSYRGSRIHSFLISALDGREWSTARPSCFTPVKEPGAHLIGGWSSRFEKEKVLLCLLKSKPTSNYTYGGILAHQKKVVVAYFKTGSRNFPGGTEE
jgi:hypothetical protein